MIRRSRFRLKFAWRGRESVTYCRRVCHARRRSRPLVLPIHVTRCVRSTIPPPLSTRCTHAAHMNSHVFTDADSMTFPVHWCISHDMWDPYVDHHVVTQCHRKSNITKSQSQVHEGWCHEFARWTHELARCRQFAWCIYVLAWFCADDITSLHVGGRNSRASTSMSAISLSYRRNNGIMMPIILKRVYFYCIGKNNIFSIFLKHP